MAFHRLTAPGRRWAAAPGPAAAHDAHSPTGGVVAEVAVGLDLGHQLQATGRREGADHPDVVQHPVVVIQAEHEGTDTVAALVPPEPGDHELGGALVLDLPHGPLVLPVGQVEGLGHHAVEPGTLKSGEPVTGLSRGRWSPG